MPKICSVNERIPDRYKIGSQTIGLQFPSGYADYLRNLAFQSGYSSISEMLKTAIFQVFIAPPDDCENEQEWIENFSQEIHNKRRKQEEFEVHEIEVIKKPTQRKKREAEPETIEDDPKPKKESKDFLPENAKEKLLGQAKKKAEPISVEHDFSDNPHNSLILNFKIAGKRTRVILATDEELEQVVFSHEWFTSDLRGCDQEFRKEQAKALWALNEETMLALAEGYEITHEDFIDWFDTLLGTLLRKEREQRKNV